MTKAADRWRYAAAHLLSEFCEFTPRFCWPLIGGEGGDRVWDGWMASLTWWTVSLSELRELVMDRETWRAAIHGVAKGWTRLSDWTDWDRVLSGYIKDNNDSPIGNVILIDSLQHRSTPCSLRYRLLILHSVYLPAIITWVWNIHKGAGRCFYGNRT